MCGPECLYKYEPSEATTLFEGEEEAYDVVNVGGIEFRIIPQSKELEGDEWANHYFAVAGKRHIVAHVYEDGVIVTYDNQKESEKFSESEKLVGFIKSLTE